MHWSIDAVDTQPGEENRIALGAGGSEGTAEAVPATRDGRSDPPFAQKRGKSKSMERGRVSATRPVSGPITYDIKARRRHAILGLLESLFLGIPAVLLLVVMMAPTLVVGFAFTGLLNIGRVVTGNRREGN